MKATAQRSPTGSHAAPPWQPTKRALMMANGGTVATGRRVDPTLDAFARGSLAERRDKRFPIGRRALERLPDLGRNGVEIEALADLEADPLQPVDHGIVERTRRIVLQQIGKAGEEGGGVIPPTCAGGGVRMSIAGSTLPLGGA